MKKGKQILKLKLVFLMGLFLLFSSSCSKSEDENPVAPHKRELTMTSPPAGDILLGEKKVFEITGLNFSESSQDIFCNFDAEDIKVWINGVVVKDGEIVTFSLNSQSLTIEAKPLIIGSHVISVNAVEANIKTTKNISITAVLKVYDVRLLNVRPMYAGLRRSMDIHFIDPARDTSLNPALNVDYIVSAKVIQGKGMIEFPRGVVWCDTIDNFEPMAVEVPNQEYKVMYTGFELGENLIEFTVTDQDGNTSTDVASIDIIPSIFELSSTPKSEDTIDRAEYYSIWVGIERFENQNLSNLFYAGARFTKGKATVNAFRDIPVIAEGVTPIIENLAACNLSSVFSFHPETEGDIEAVIEVHDSYGTIHEVPVKFFVNGDGYNILFDVEENQDAFTTQSFDLEISGSTDELNEYEMSVSLETGNANNVNLSMNNRGNGYVDVLEKGFVEIGKHPWFNISFTAEGTYKLKFEFTDRYSEPKERFLIFTVVDNPLKVEMGADQTIVLGEQDFHYWTAMLSVPTGEGGSSDTWKNATIKYSLPQGDGVTEVDADFSGLKVIQEITALNTDECHFKFTPKKTGIHKPTFIFTLADGRVVTKTKIFNVTYSSVNLNFGSNSSTIYEGETSRISLYATHAGYTEDLTYRYEFLGGCSGQITTTEGTLLVAGTTYALTQGELEELTFATNGYIGPVRIKFTVTGGDDMTATNDASFLVERGVSMSLVPPSTIMMGEKPNFVLNITHPNYSGDFDVKYEVVYPHPTYTGSGTFAEFNTDGEMTTSTSVTNLTFTPTAAGSTQLKMTVTDNTGVSISQILNFNILLAPLVVNPTHINAPNQNIEHIITVTIPEVNPDGKYQFSYTFLDEWGDNNWGKEGMMYFEESEREFLITDVKTLDKGTYTLRYKSRTINIHSLKFTIIDPNGVITSTIIKVTKD